MHMKFRFYGEINKPSEKIMGRWDGLGTCIAGKDNFLNLKRFKEESVDFFLKRNISCSWFLFYYLGCGDLQNTS